MEITKTSDDPNEKIASSAQEIFKNFDPQKILGENFATIKIPPVVEDICLLFLETIDAPMSPYSIMVNISSKWWV